MAKRKPKAAPKPLTERDLRDFLGWGWGVEELPGNEDCPVIVRIYQGDQSEQRGGKTVDECVRWFKERPDA